MAARRNGKLSAIFKSGKGFTLVEMIVVLVVLAILAASGIGAASGYIKRSTLTKNDSNAETVYQAAQTALQQMQKTGHVYYDDTNDTNVYSSKWIEDVISKGTAFSFSTDNLSANMNDNATYFANKYKAGPFNSFDAASAKTNESVHMRYVLNYSKDNASDPQSSLVKQLLQPYFNDSTVFMGAITLELDVEKSADAYGKLHCSAKCLSVFFDSRAAGGFPSSRLSTDNRVPVRDTAQRVEKTLIGYYDGYKGTAVDTVHLPKVQQGIVVKKFMNETSTETVDIKNDADEVIERQEITHGWITWASTLDTVNLNGAQKDVYYRLELLKGNNVDNILMLNEDFLLSDDVVGNARHSIDYSALAGFDEVYFPSVANGGNPHCDAGQDLSYMFRFRKDISAVENLGELTVNTATITTMQYIFSNLGAYELDISGINLTGYTKSVKNMFDTCSRLTTIYVAPGTDWSGESFSDVTNFFNGSNKLVGRDITGTHPDFSYSGSNKAYARVNGINGNNGYFTAKS